MSLDEALAEIASLLEGRRRVVSVCSPEDLVIHKIVSDRARDFTDIIGVLRRQRSAMDFRYLDPIIEGLARDLVRPEILDRYRRAKAEARVAHPE